MSSRRNTVASAPSVSEEPRELSSICMEPDEAAAAASLGHEAEGSGAGVSMEVEGVVGTPTRDGGRGSLRQMLVERSRQQRKMQTLAKAPKATSDRPPPPESPAQALSLGAAAAWRALAGLYTALDFEHQAREAAFRTQYWESTSWIFVVAVVVGLLFSLVRVAMTHVYLAIGHAEYSKCCSWIRDVDSGDPIQQLPSLYCDLAAPLFGFVMVAGRDSRSSLCMWLLPRIHPAFRLQNGNVNVGAVGECVLCCAAALIGIVSVSQGLFGSPLVCQNIIQTEWVLLTYPILMQFNFRHILIAYPISFVISWAELAVAVARDAEMDSKTRTRIWSVHAFSWITIVVAASLLVRKERSLRKRYMANMMEKKIEARYLNILRQMLPEKAIDRLASSAEAQGDFEPFADVYGACSVVFVRVNIEEAGLDSHAMVSELNRIFEQLDSCVEAGRDCYKVETVGGEYLFASGVPSECAKHACRATAVAVAMLQIGCNQHWSSGVPVRMRVGIHSGSLVAGIAGRAAPRFRLFGDTVNTASRMKSQAGDNELVVSTATRGFVDACCAGACCGGVVLDSLGERFVKGKGNMIVHGVRLRSCVTGEWQLSAAPVSGAIEKRGTIDSKGTMNRTFTRSHDSSKMFTRTEHALPPPVSCDSWVEHMGSSTILSEHEQEPPSNVVPRARSITDESLEISRRVGVGGTALIKSLKGVLNFSAFKKGSSIDLYDETEELHEKDGNSKLQRFIFDLADGHNAGANLCSCFHQPGKSRGDLNVSAGLLAQIPSKASLAQYWFPLFWFKDVSVETAFRRLMHVNDVGYPRGTLLFLVAVLGVAIVSVAYDVAELDELEETDDRKRTTVIVMVCICLIVTPVTLSALIWTRLYRHAGVIAEVNKTAPLVSVLQAVFVVAIIVLMAGPINVYAEDMGTGPWGFVEKYWTVMVHSYVVYSQVILSSSTDIVWLIIACIIVVSFITKAQLPDARPGAGPNTCVDPFLTDTIFFVLQLFQLGWVQVMQRRAFALNVKSSRIRKFGEALAQDLLPDHVLCECLLPSSSKEKLLRGDNLLCGHLFSDVAGFTAMASKMAPEDAFLMVSQLFRVFDGLCDKWRVTKIETVGDAYWCAVGVEEGRATQEDMARLLGMAMEMQSLLSGGSLSFMSGVETKMKMRIGVHYGPCVGCVVGTKMPRYHLFGAAVDIAQCLEQAGSVEGVLLSRAAMDVLHMRSGLGVASRAPGENGESIPEGHGEAWAHPVSPALMKMFAPDGVSVEEYSMDPNRISDMTAIIQRGGTSCMESLGKNKVVTSPQLSPVADCASTMSPPQVSPVTGSAETTSPSPMEPTTTTKGLKALKPLPPMRETVSGTLRGLAPLPPLPAEQPPLPVEKQGGEVRAEAVRHPEADAATLPPKDSALPLKDLMMRRRTGPQSASNNSVLQLGWQGPNVFPVYLVSPTSSIRGGRV